MSEPITRTDVGHYVIRVKGSSSVSDVAKHVMRAIQSAEKQRLALVMHDLRGCPPNTLSRSISQGLRNMGYLVFVAHTYNDDEMYDRLYIDLSRSQSKR